MRTIESRVADLESKLHRLQNDPARNPVRDAKPLAPRRGWFLGVTHTDFTKGTDEFVTVEQWIWSITDTAWKKTGNIVTGRVRDWFLEDGDTMPRGTKVRVDYYETTFVLTIIACDASTDEDVIESLPTEGE